MADTRTDTEPKASKRARMERRFEAATTRQAVASLVAIALGGAVLGAGVYAQWICAVPMEKAPWIVGAGALLLAAVIVWGDFGGLGVRVGDAGIALERPGSPLTRVGWNSLKSIRFRNNKLHIEGHEAEITLSALQHPAATAWIIKEAKKRLPKKVDLPADMKSKLPQAKASDGVLVPIETLQVTGRHCRASDRVITFEQDAYFCPNCGEVYLRDALPESCLTCEASLRAARS